MHDLYERIVELCNQRGIKPGKMCIEVGISKNIISELKSGRRVGININTAQKIANYFNVPIDYLTDNPVNSPENRTVEMLQSLRDVDRNLMEEARNANADDVQAARDYLNYLKGLRNDRGD